MATVENSLSQIRGKYFSKIDANSGFWQIPLEKSSWEYTHFLTSWGRFHYRKLPFGLTSAPEIFSKEMNRILKDEENVIIHMDDVLIMGDTEESHDKSVQNVLNKIRAAGMTLNKKKCCFKQKEVEFLGFKISEKGIGAGEQIKAIELFPVPEHVKAIKSFLGLINQYARFSKNIAEFSTPIRILLKKDITWRWGDPQQKSFEKNKGRIQIDQNFKII